MIHEECFEVAELSAFVKHSLMAVTVFLELDPMKQGTNLLDIHKAVKAIKNGKMHKKIERDMTRVPKREYTCGTATNVSNKEAKPLKVI